MDEILVRFQVEDTGEGIDDEKRRQLYQLFGYVPRDKSVKAERMGLGLTASNEILK